MSKFNTILAGYRFTFVSWENDGDNKKTIVKEGVQEAEAKLLGKLASLIQLGGCGLENNYEPSEKEQKKAFKILLPIFEKHKDIFDESDMNLFRKDVGQMVDYINENMLGHGEDGYWMRALQSTKVEYIPEEINIEDVTSKFV